MSMPRTITIQRPLILVEQISPNGDRTCSVNTTRAGTCAALEDFSAGFRHRCSLTGKEVTRYGYGYLRTSPGCPWDNEQPPTHDSKK